MHDRRHEQDYGLRDLRSAARAGGGRATAGGAGPGGDGGYATAEAAVAVPALLVVLALALAVVSAIGAQLRCVDAARAAARVAARGDTDAVAAAAARPVAPPGAEVRLVRSGGQVRVDVAARVPLLGAAVRLLPPLRVSGSAVAESEQGASGHDGNGVDPAAAR